MHRRRRVLCGGNRHSGRTARGAINVTTCAQDFGEACEAVLSAGTPHLDSGDAGTGLIALKEASGGKDLEMEAAMQRAFYLDGLSLPDTGTQRTIVTREGLDPDLVVSRQPVRSSDTGTVS